MKFLIRPRPYNTESLESYLLRVALANAYHSFREVAALAEKKHQLSNSEKATTSSICRLPSVNFYLEKSPNISRVEIFSTLALLVGLDFQQLSNLSFHKSNVIFCNDYKAVDYQGKAIPHCFIREKHIPICTKCLRESVFIRQIWHFSPYKSCHIHQTPLLTNCPQCGQYIDYRLTESLTHCSCGFDLLTVKSNNIKQVNYPDFITQNEDTRNSGLIDQCSTSWKLAMLLWYFQRFESKPPINLAEISTDHLVLAEHYFKTWPQSLINELNEKLSQAEYLMIDVPSKIPFHKVFGCLIPHAVLMKGYEEKFEPVVDVVRNFLFQLIDNNPLKGSSNIADLLVSIDDIAIVFSASHKDVNELLIKGEIKSSRRLKTKGIIEVYQPLFPLRSIRYLEFINDR